MILAIPAPIAIGGSVLFAVVGALMLVGTSLQAYTAFAMSRREAALPGHVESGASIVEGTARPLDGELLDVAGTDRDVLAYEYKVKRYIEDNNSGTTVDSGDESVPFVLEGGGGEVVVDPEGADIRIADGPDDLSAETFVQTETDATDGPDIVVATFDAIEPGETVTVAGRVERDEGRPTVAGPIAPRTRVKVFDEGSEAAFGTQLRSTLSGLLLALGLVGVGLWGMSATLL